MSRFFQGQVFQPVQNTLYSMPFEQIANLIKDRDARVDQNLALADALETQLGQLKYLAPQQEQAFALHERYKNMINEATQQVLDNPLDVFGNQQMLRGLSKEVKNDMTNGEWADIMYNYNAFQQWQEKNKELKKSNPGDYDRVMRYGMNQFINNLKTDKKARLSMEDVLTPFDVRGLTEKVNKVLKASSYNRDTGKWLVNGKELTYDQILNFAINEVMADPKAQAAHEQMARMGVRGLFEDVTDSNGNVIGRRAINPFVTVDKDGKRYTQEELQGMDSKTAKELGIHRALNSDWYYANSVHGLANDMRYREENLTANPYGLAQQNHIYAMSRLYAQQKHDKEMAYQKHLWAMERDQHKNQNGNGRGGSGRGGGNGASMDIIANHPMYNFIAGAKSGAEALEMFKRTLSNPDLAISGKARDFLRNGMDKYLEGVKDPVQKKLLSSYLNYAINNGKEFSEKGMIEYLAGGEKTGFILTDDLLDKSKLNGLTKGLIEEIKKGRYPEGMNKDDILGLMGDKVWKKNLLFDNPLQDVYQGFEETFTKGLYEDTRDSKLEIYKNTGANANDIKTLLTGLAHLNKSESKVVDMNGQVYNFNSPALQDILEDGRLALGALPNGRLAIQSEDGRTFMFTPENQEQRALIQKVINDYNPNLFTEHNPLINGFQNQGLEYIPEDQQKAYIMQSGIVPLGNGNFAALNDKGWAVAIDYLQKNGKVGEITKVIDNTMVSAVGKDVKELVTYQSQNGKK